MSSHFVAAVVVTYNRADLLLHCLRRLSTQTRPPNLIILIDNASSDRTHDVLLENGIIPQPKIHYIKLSQNKGGAYGFSLGIKLACKQRADWIWLMDDDCFPAPTALQKLLESGDIISNNSDTPPAVLVSQVRWTDGTPHPMNWPIPRVRPEERFFIAVDRFKAIPIRSASFVSCLINGRVATEEALPLSKYFIWNDDVEYTSRLLKFRDGYLIPESIAIHATDRKYTSAEESGDRIFFETRNKLWLIFRSCGLFFPERIRIAKSLLKNIFQYCKYHKFSYRSCMLILKGIFAAFGSPYDKS